MIIGRIIKNRLARAPVFSAIALLALVHHGQAQPNSRPNANAPGDGCSAPAPVCAARGAVFMISSFEPVVSAVRIGPNRLVTNRHAVADETSVRITLKDGRKITARVIPSSYAGDLILLEADGLGEGPVLTPGASDFSGALYTVGADLSRRKVLAYRPGRKLAAPAPGHPLARLHHSAYSQPGNSGGALLDDNGRLVAVIAGGGARRFDAVAATEIAKLAKLSGPDHRERSLGLGRALRACVEQLERMPRNPRATGPKLAQRLHDLCAVSENRPLYDRAAQILGIAGARDLSRALSEKALARDPNSVLSRLTLLTTLIFARDHKAALPHVQMLIDSVPENQAVQRYAIQVGKITGDMTLARKGLELVRKHNPAQAEAAERYLNAPVRVPPQRPQRR